MRTLVPNRLAASRRRVWHVHQALAAAGGGSRFVRISYLQQVRACGSRLRAKHLADGCMHVTRCWQLVLHCCVVAALAAAPLTCGLQSGPPRPGCPHPARTCRGV